MTTFSGPLLIGLETIERAAAGMPKSGGDGYPPFNIERLVRESGDEVIRVTLAVAGFTEADLDVSVEEGHLVIRGKQAEIPTRTYLYRGIAARQFQRSFMLADGIEVLGADLRDGLLSIDLARPVADRTARRVKINGLA